MSGRDTGEAYGDKCDKKVKEICRARDGKSGFCSGG